VDREGERHFGCGWFPRCSRISVIGGPGRGGCFGSNRAATWFSQSEWFITVGPSVGGYPPPAAARERQEVSESSRSGVNPARHGGGWGGAATHDVAHPLGIRRNSAGCLPSGRHRLIAAEASADAAAEGFLQIQVVLEVPTSCRSRPASCGHVTPVNNRLGGAV
jgi:hypothetical protein